jgi:hypothetical protein
LIFTSAGSVGAVVAVTVIEVELDVVLEDAVVTEAGNAGCTTDVPDVNRGTLVVEETIEVAAIVVADVVVAAMVGVDAPA